MDYCWMDESAIIDLDCEDVEGKHAILVTFDECKEAFWALQVDKKGPSASATRWSVDRLDGSGYTGVGITVKSDQEESIVALRKSIAVGRQAETVPINSILQSGARRRMAVWRTL